MGENSFDKIYIGTSPVNIIDAVIEKKQGGKILLLDDKANIGGAWTTIDDDVLSEIEIGCHIWSFHLDSYKFLQEFLNLELSPLNPQPLILKKDRRIPYDWKMNAITIKRIFSNLKKAKFHNFKSDYYNPAFRFNLLPSKYLYPKNGATSLINSLKIKIEENDLEVRLKTKVNRIKIENSQASIFLENDEKIISKQLVITSLSDIREITFDDTSVILPDPRIVNYCHVHLIVNDIDGKPFSYIRWMDDEIIHRISDVTNQVKKKIESNQRVIIIGIHEEAFSKYEKDQLIELIAQKLKDKKYLGENTSVRKGFFNVFPSSYQDADTLIEIEKKSKGLISVIRSTDFIYSISQKLKLWKSLLSTCQK